MTNPLHRIAAVLLGLAVSLPAIADAAMLCASRTGLVQVRETCRRSETIVDVTTLGGPADDLPLENWKVASRTTDGLASAAAAPDATFVNLDPCRLIDTRPGQASAFVGDDIGSFASAETRTYALAGLCDIPAEATALSINLAVVPGPENGFASLGPGGSIVGTPSFASINFQGSGPAISNSLIVPLDALGVIDAYAARVADLIIDTNGYFAPKDAGTNTWYVPGTGTDSENGAALAAVIAEVNALPTTARYKVELGPGVFDIGTTQLLINRTIALVGAGAEVSKIVCDCTFAAIQLMNSATDAELRDVHVENVGAGGTARALGTNGSHRLIISNARVTSDSSQGMTTNNTMDLRLENVQVQAARVGVSAHGAGIEIRGCTISSNNNEALTVVEGDTTVDDSTLEALATGAAITVNYDGTSAIVRHSRLISDSGSYAGGTLGTSKTLSLHHNFVDGTTMAFTGGTASCTSTGEPSAFTGSGCP